MAVAVEKVTGLGGIQNSVLVLSIMPMQTACPLVLRAKTRVMKKSKRAGNNLLTFPGCLFLSKGASNSITKS